MPEDDIVPVAQTFEGPSARKEARANRPAVPAAVRHLVWARDGGQCAWRYPDGTRCSERMMLELDHLTMWCRGGEHDPDNLELRCRHHNHFAAEQDLGIGFMAKWHGPRGTRGVREDSGCHNDEINVS